MKTIETFGLTSLNYLEKLEINGGDAVEGSYGVGHAIGSWFNSMYKIWSDGIEQGIFSK